MRPRTRMSYPMPGRSPQNQADVFISPRGHSMHSAEPSARHRATIRGVFRVLDCQGPNGGTLYIAVDRRNRKRGEVEVLEGQPPEDAIGYLEDLLDRVDPDLRILR